MILTDEQTREAIVKEWRVMFDEPMPDYEVRNAVAEAQEKQTLKAVGEWLVSDCPHMNYQQRHLCQRCRREALEALKQGKFPER